MILGAVLTLLFVFALGLIVRLRKEPEVGDSPIQSEPDTGTSGQPHPLEKGLKLQFGKRIERVDPTFRERWPHEGKKWKEQTAVEKFATTAKVTLICTLIAVATGTRVETICHLLNSFSGYLLFIVGIFACLAFRRKSYKTEMVQ